MFNPPIKLVEESKWLLALTSLECTNSVFNKTNVNNSFSITIPGHWNSKLAQKAFDDISKLLDFRSGDDIELHTEQVWKKGLFLIKVFSLSSLGTFKNEKLEELNNVKYILVRKIWCIDSN